MAATRSVEVVRAGTALSVAGRVMRWIDLAPQLGAPDPRRSRFTAARLAGDSVEVELAGGGRERVDLRQPDRVLVVETRGPLMTSDPRGADPLGLIEGGALVAIGGRVEWTGRSDELFRTGIDLSRAVRIDAGDRLVSPGLVDCHAHPIFAGDRSDEFARRAAGQSYLEIARAGGGIAATVAATRAASFDDLVALTCARLDGALAAGTTTMEAKSGYDLTVEGELRLLEVARAADSLHSIDLEPTLLGAHVVPADRDRTDYVTEVVEQMIPRAAAAGLCGAVDVYCDEGAFTRDETRRILDAARSAGLLLRAHVGQFADLGAGEMVAELGGVSVDHVEQLSPAAMRILAAHSVVAVMLPGACVQLKLAPPPVAALRAAGVALAVASDLNPGSSHCESLPIQMWLAATHYGMTVEEAWLGVTRHAGRALGRADVGWLGPGAAADLVLWNARRPAEIPYRYGAANLVHQVIKCGRALPRNG
jgi:imidazolonepropionase